MQISNGDFFLIRKSNLVVFGITQNDLTSVIASQCRNDFELTHA